MSNGGRRDRKALQALQGVNVGCGLRRNPAFLAVASEEVRTIQSFRSATRVVEAGGHIVSEDRPSARLFTLHSGWLRILEPHALETPGDDVERPMQPAPLV